MISINRKSCLIQVVEQAIINVVSYQPLAAESMANPEAERLVVR